MIHFIPVLHSAFSMTKAPLMSLVRGARKRWAKNARFT